MTKHSARKIPVYGFFPLRKRSETQEGAQTKKASSFVVQPLASAMIFESARLARGGALGERYDFSIGVLHSIEAIEAAVKANGPGVALFSDYVWSAEQNLEASRLLKELSPDSLTVHGGPSAPKYEAACAEFLRKTQHVDVVARGEGEHTIIDLLDVASDYLVEQTAAAYDRLADVEGITFVSRGDGTVVRTADRATIKELDDIPSPYLTGFFDREGWSPEDLRYSWITLETNRGCPYGCTFCDWGSATLQKIRKFGLDRVRQELEWAAERKVERIFVADANFGILPRDIEIAQIVAETKQRYGYPLIVTTNYAKNGATRLPQIFHMWKDAGITFDPVISIQTTDAKTLETIKRANIKTEKYMELGSAYREMRLPFTIQLMMGLPGSTVSSWKNDLQFFFDRLEDTQMFSTRLLPNSPMADPAYMSEHAIVIDEDESVVACKSFTREDFEVMGDIAIVFSLFSNWMLMRWLLLHLQWDRGIRALDFMHEVASAVRKGDTRYPESIALFGAFFERGFTKFPGRRAERFDHLYQVPGAWTRFYDEMIAHAVREHGVEQDSALDVARTVQEALRPVKGAAMPRSIDLAHDFVAYIRAGMDVVYADGTDAPSESRRLSEYGPGSLTLTDPYHLCEEDDARGLPHANGVHPGWELQSPLRDVDPSPAFLASRLLQKRRKSEKTRVALPLKA